MNLQVSLVGGQVLPVFIGLKEFAPDHLHFVATQESKSLLDAIRPLVPPRSFTVHVCDPFDFGSIKSTIEAALIRSKPEDKIQFNLTGGTKLMSLAAQAVMQASGSSGFYISKNESAIVLPEYREEPLSCSIPMADFFALSGHRIGSSRAIADITPDEIRASNDIARFGTANRQHTHILAHFKKKYKDLHVIPPSGVEYVSRLTVRWAGTTITVESGGVVILRVTSRNIKDIFFNGAWWEVLVAEEIGKWTAPVETCLQCKLPYRIDNSVTKNEIDILINLGRQLMFVECKSGDVKQEDLYKIKAIRQTYGGIISKSILVSRYKPKPIIIEKSKEMDIEVFFLYDDRGRQIHSLVDLIPALQSLWDKRTL